MTYQHTDPHAGPIQSLQVLCSDSFKVSHGVNQGDALSPGRDMVMEDVYMLSEHATTRRLALIHDEVTGAFAVAAETSTGQPGAALFLDSVVTFMGPNGTTDEALILVETDPETGAIAEVYLHPLSPIHPKTGYTLVTVDQDGARAKLAESACVSFTRGTNITMADGRQVPVEDLRPGDRILTKDNGAQVLRWIGMQTMRATGAFAPIVIAAGAMNNAGELTVSPNHRLFIYQRVDTIGAGQKEVLVKARNLVNGTSVVASQGGFVDYFQLLFDKHEIIFAEGIASESLFVDTTTRPIVPHDVRARLLGDAAPVRAGHELRASDLAAKDAVSVLKRASTM